MNPEPFHKLDRVIHEKGRLAILSMLAAAPDRALSFRDLREGLGMTDGNLSVHLKTLKGAGYVRVEKSFRDNRPLTTCVLTPEGRKAFADYIDQLEAIVRQNRDLGGLGGR